MKIYLVGMSAQIKVKVSDSIGYILAPDDVAADLVRHAWSYAVRYSAKGLDVPDYEAAAKLLMQRHPSWQCATGIPVDFIYYQAAYADGDKPD